MRKTKVKKILLLCASLFLGSIVSAGPREAMYVAFTSQFGQKNFDIKPFESLFAEDLTKKLNSRVVCTSFAVLISQMEKVKAVIGSYTLRVHKIFANTVKFDVLFTNAKGEHEEIAVIIILTFNEEGKITEIDEVFNTVGAL